MSLAILDPNHSTFTGFGDDTDDSIKFRILRGRDGSAPDWEGGEAKVATFEPLHSNDEITQYGGRSPYEIAMRIWFADIESLELLTSVQGRYATLRYLWGITSRAGGHKATLPDGVSYLVLPNTRLVGLSDRSSPAKGRWEATATFRRAVGVGTAAAAVGGFGEDGFGL